MARMDRMIIVHLWEMRVKRNAKRAAQIFAYMVSGNRVGAMRQPGEKWFSESYTRFNAAREWIVCTHMQYIKR